MNLTIFLATGHIALLLLVIGLFFPRLALLFGFLATGNYPPNILSVLLSFFSWIFFPRFLMAYYIYTDIGTTNFWFWAYLVTGIAGFFGESRFVQRRIIRRTEVTRHGNTTTTIEEHHTP